MPTSTTTTLQYEFSFAINVTTFYEEVSPGGNDGNGTDNGQNNGGSTNSNSSKMREEGLISQAMIIGLGVGGGVLTILLGILIVVLVRRKQKQPKVTKIGIEVTPHAQ